jgi:TolB-like protein
MTPVIIPLSFALKRLHRTQGLWLSLFTLMLCLQGCSITPVRPTPVMTQQYDTVQPQGQVPPNVQQDLGQQYPPGFWQQSNTAVPPGQRIKVAIKPFSSRPDQPDLAQSVTEVFADIFTRSQAFSVVEREEMGQVLNEFEVSQSGLVDTTDAPEAGNMEAPTIMVTGDVIQLGNDCRIEARAIDIKSGKVLISERITPPAVTIQAAETLARQLIAKMQDTLY